jgi:N-methylhydantoinase B
LTEPARLLFDALAGRSHTSPSAYRADARLGDFFAQISACRSGVNRLAALVDGLGVDVYRAAIGALNDYAERLARAAIAGIEAGVYTFADVMDDDGAGNRNVPLRVRLTIEGSTARVDFTASAEQVRGNINCPLSVTAAAVLYVFRCLMPVATPAVSGAFRCIEIVTRPGSLLDARRPAAVAAGNVETSMRIVDFVLGALAQALPQRIPAASQGTMNNVAMGRHGADERWDYYETIAGGSGAWAHGNGASAIQTHMTNTLNTPIESLETHYPLRVLRYGLRGASGGTGRFDGGDGVVREFEFLEPTSVTLLTERRNRGPWGVAGGGPGQPGVNLLNGKVLPAKVALEAQAGDVLTVLTPGGGGWGGSG